MWRIKENEFFPLKGRNRSRVYSYGKRQQRIKKKGKRRAVDINLIIDIQNSSCDMCWWVGGREGVRRPLAGLYMLRGGSRERLQEAPTARTCAEAKRPPL